MSIYDDNKEYWESVDPTKRVAMLEERVKSLEEEKSILSHLQTFLSFLKKIT